MASCTALAYNIVLQWNTLFLSEYDYLLYGCTVAYQLLSIFFDTLSEYTV